MGEDEIQLMLGEEHENKETVVTPLKLRFKTNDEPTEDTVDIDPHLLLEQIAVDFINANVPTPIKNLSIASLHRPVGKEI